MKKIPRTPPTNSKQFVAKNVGAVLIGLERTRTSMWWRHKGSVFARVLSRRTALAMLLAVKSLSSIAARFRVVFGKSKSTDALSTRCCGRNRSIQRTCFKAYTDVYHLVSHSRVATWAAVCIACRRMHLSKKEEHLFIFIPAKT